MADLFDRFTGGSGVLSGHTADSGDTWSDPLSVCSIDGSGSVYTSGTFDYSNIPLSSWTPPTNSDHAYAVSIVVGADFASQTSATISIALRVSGAAGSQSYYAVQCYWDSGVQTIGSFRVVSGSIELITGQTPVAVTLSADDVVTAEITGAGATVTITVFKNGTQVYQVIDSDSERRTATGAVGLRIISVAGHTDMIRGIWAGDVGGPTGGITPVSPSINLNDSQVFTATGALPNEVINWSATHGTITGSPSVTVTYTAPSLYTSDTITWTSADLPNRGFSDSVTLIGASGRHIDSSSDAISVVNSHIISTSSGFCIIMLVKFDAGSTTIGSSDFFTLASQTGSATADNVFAFILSGPGNPFVVPSPPASNFLIFYVSDGAGNFQSWKSTFDPFAGLAGNNGYNLICLDYNAFNYDNGGSCVLTINGTSYASQVTGPDSQWIRYGASLLSGSKLGSTSNQLNFGASDPSAGWPALPGMTYSHISILRNDNLLSGQTILDYSGTYSDIYKLSANLPAGPSYPPEVVQETQQVDILDINGTDPELGFKSVLSATITGTSVVTGPLLYGNLDVIATFNHSGNFHTPGTGTLTIAYDLSIPFVAPPAPVNFTLTPPFGSFSPNPVTLGTSSGSTASSVFTIPSSETLQSYFVNVTNDGGIAPFSVAFTLVSTQALVTRGMMMPCGNLIALFAQNGSGTPRPITACNPTGSYIQVNGGSHVDVSSLTPMFNGKPSYGDPFLHFNVGTGIYTNIIDDADSTNFHKTGTWTTGISTASLRNQNFDYDWFNNNGAGTLSYSNDMLATGMWDFGTIASGNYYPSINSPDIYTGSAQESIGPGTTDAQYVITDGTRSYAFHLNQRLIGAQNDCEQLYSWTDVNAANITPIITLGVLTGVNIVSGGSGYSSTPSVVIQSATGTGAVATATLTSGVVTSINISNGGSGYTEQTDIVIQRESIFLDGPVTVTVTNAGSGTLYADAFKLTSVETRLANHGDTITWFIPDAMFSTNDGSCAQQTLTFACETQSQFAPFDSGGPRKLKIGYNLAGLSTNSPQHTFANRIKTHSGYTDVFPATHTVDSNGQLTGISTGGSVTLQTLTTLQNGNGDNYRGIPSEPFNSNVTILFDVPAGGNPTVTLGTDSRYATLGAAYSGGSAGSTPSAPYQQTVSGIPFVLYNPSFSLIVTNNGGANDYITNLRIFDDYTGPTYAHLTHPTLRARVAAFSVKGMYRFLDPCQVALPGPVSRTDIHEPNDSFYGNFKQINTATITAIDPVTSATPDALLLAQNLFPNHSSQCVVKITFNSGPVFTLGQLVYWSGFTTVDNYPDTASSLSNFNDLAFIAPLTSTTAVVVIHSNSPGTSGDPITLVSPATLNGSEVMRTMLGSNCMPYEDAFTFLSENSCDGYMQSHLLADDDFIYQIGKIAATTLTPGLKWGLGKGNELWNDGNFSFFYCDVQNRNQNSLWSSSSGAQGAPLDSSDDWGVWRSGQEGALALSGFVGNPEVRISGPGTGATAYAVLSGGSVSNIVMTGYVSSFTITSSGSGYTSQPTVTLIGGLGFAGIPAKATATISGGHVTGITCDDGWGYESAPMVVISGGGGSGATATASMTLAGTGYTSAPTVTINGGYWSDNGGVQAVAGTPTVSGGKVTVIPVSNGGSGYTTTGRSASDFYRIIASNSGSQNTTQNIAVAMAKFSVPMDMFALGEYQPNVPTNGPYKVSSGGPVPDSDVDNYYSNLQANDIRDLNLFHSLYSDTSALTYGHIGVFNAHGVKYKFKFSAYEEGLDAGCPFGYDGIRRSHLTVRGLDVYQYRLARIQLLENAGFDYLIPYTDSAPNGLAGGANWQTWWCGSNGDGTILQTTANPYLLTSLAPQQARANIDYTSTPTPTPTPTPTATHLAVIVQPSSSITAGSPFSLTFAAEDGVGSIDTTYNSNISIAIDHNPSHGVLSGTLTVAATSGIATFTGLSINKAGSGYTIKATATGLTSIDTIGFAIVGGPATKLLFTTEPPGTAYINGLFSVDISGVDAFDNTDPTYTASVTIALDANPGPAILGGTLTHSAVSGRARFTGLSLDVIASGYTIAASNGVLTDATSNSVVVVAAPPPGTNFGFWFFGN